MKRVVIFALLFLLGLQGARAVWQFEDKPFSGKYVIYGGLLPDASPPKPGDTKVAFTIKGKAAQDLFDTIGPDLHGVCGADEGFRVRERGALSCRLYPKWGYVCDFGLDLGTGGSIRGSVC